MRKRYAALIVIHLVALAFAAYPYVMMATFEAPESSQKVSFSATPMPATPTHTPGASPTTEDTGTRVSFNHWDPHDIAYPNQIDIVSPRSNSTLPTGYLYLQVGVSSSNWLINGVFYTADWIIGPQPIWYYNLRAAETALFATVAIPNVPEGSHTLSVHANLHDDTLLTSSVSFSVEPTNFKVGA
jgi:hypothetical protein